MDYQAVQSPSNYGAPNVFQDQQQAGQQQQQSQPSADQQVAAALSKAKQLLSQGLISSDQYNQLATKIGAPAVSGNPAEVFPGASGDPYRNTNVPDGG